MNSELSTYTISIYELIESGFDFGLDKYEIFDENYRSTLNDAILNFYMFREIGFTNPNVWKQKLKNRMDIIMRNKYNALYKAKLMEFNPLYTMELYEDYTHSINNTTQNSNTGEVNYNTVSATNSTSNESSNVKSSDNSERDSSNIQFTSQFPSEEMVEGDLSNSLYADGAQNSKASESASDTTNQNSTSNGTNNVSNSGTDKTTNSNNGTENNNMTESYSKKTIGSASDLTFAHAMTQFKDYVESFNLDQLIIDELSDLFMNVW
jgi:hypothetical protein